jgi:hypothetical protein
VFMLAVCGCGVVIHWQLLLAALELYLLPIQGRIRYMRSEVKHPRLN